MYLKALCLCFGTEAAVLIGNKPSTIGVSEVILKNAEGAFALMGMACEAVKDRRWDEAEEILKKMQSMVHQLRVDVRDERLPSDPPGIETHEGQNDSRRDGSR